MSEIGIKNQCFGVEVEMTGITRERAAQVLAKYFDASPYYKGTVYETWAVQDNEGKEWKLMGDSSIRPEVKTEDGYETTYDSDYRVEMVTPKLTYAELPKFQECVKRLRKAGAKVNGSCGLHVHVDASNHNRQSLKNLLGIMYSKEDILFKALRTKPERVEEWCQKVREPMLREARKLSADETKDLTQLEDIWYEGFENDGRTRRSHYNKSRYYALNLHRVDRLRTVFWDMTKITTEVKTVDHPATDDEEAWTETVLVITVTPRTVDDMRVFYSFTEEQNELLDQLQAADSRDLWNQLLYGSTGEIVAVALSQVGNVGGEIYWSWYGFSDHVNWCACFVSWCANECGYIDAGIIPRFSSCTAGSNWFKNRGQWKDNSYEPRPGDLIFFDWERKGSSGPQDDVPDHVGIVERVENGVVYTVEGNTSDSCRQRSYSVGHYEIWGYATPFY